MVVQVLAADPSWLDMIDRLVSLLMKESLKNRLFYLLVGLIMLTFKYEDDNECQDEDSGNDEDDDYSEGEDRDQKLSLVRSILESSILLRYQNLIEDILMRIPMKDLEAFLGPLDRVVVLCSETYGATEEMHFVCLARHETKLSDLRIRGEQAMVVEPVRHESWMIILVEDQLEKLTKQKKQYVVAHEFAHVYLKHGRIREDGRPADMNEDEADEQVRKWGFKTFRLD